MHENKRFWLATFLLVTFLLAFSALAAAKGVPWKDPKAESPNIKIERDATLKLSDGTTLYSDIYRPEGEGPWPVLLMRVPYDKTQAENLTYAQPSWYARHGYMVVIQDTRGRYKSEGEWYPFKHEAQDGLETLKWVKSLPGSNGKIGMYGFSYGGSTQLLPVVHSPKELATIMPAFTGSDFYEGWTYKGGALHHAFTQYWADFLAINTAFKKGDYVLGGKAVQALYDTWENFRLPPQAHPVLFAEGLAPYYGDWLKHTTYDDYWKQWSIFSHYDKVMTPALHMSGWYDIFLEGTIQNFNGMQEQAGSEAARKNQKLVIGPWYHMPWMQKIGQLDFGTNGRNCLDALQVLWLDKQLKGKSNQLDKEPPVAIFIMGDNEWRFENEWPLKRAVPTNYYLHSGGRANSLNGDGTLNTAKPKKELTDEYTFDPGFYMNSLGGKSCCFAALTPMGPVDQRPEQYRNEVLIYTSGPLKKDLEVTGPIEMILYAKSTAVDTDFTAMLCDVYPDGRSINLTDGIVRARLRDSVEEPKPLTPGEIVKYRIRLGSTANVFKAGHRIRVAVSSSNFPYYDVNTNSGGPAYFVASQTIFHNDTHPSHVVLPVIPR